MRTLYPKVMLYAVLERTFTKSSLPAEKKKEKNLYEVYNHVLLGTCLTRNNTTKPLAISP